MTENNLTNIQINFLQGVLKIILDDDNYNLIDNIYFKLELLKSNEKTEKEILILEQLKTTNFLDRTFIGLNSIKENDVINICNKYNCEYETQSHGGWEWIVFKRNSKILDRNELIGGE